MAKGTGGLNEVRGSECNRSEKMGITKGAFIDDTDKNESKRIFFSIHPYQFNFV